MTRFLVEINGPQELAPDDVQTVVTQALPKDFTVTTVGTNDMAFCAVTVFTEDMTELSRGLQALEPGMSETFFATEHVRTEETGLVVYRTETKFKRDYMGAMPANWPAGEHR